MTLRTLALDSAQQIIAAGLAQGALGMGLGSREVERRNGVVPGFIGAVGMPSDGNPVPVPVPGRVVVRDAQGRLLGAVGISGETSNNDETAAVAGIHVVGLVADTGAPKA